MSSSSPGPVSMASPLPASGGRLECSPAAQGRPAPGIGRSCGRRRPSSSTSPSRPTPTDRLGFVSVSPDDQHCGSTHPMRGRQRLSSRLEPSSSARSLPSWTHVEGPVRAEDKTTLEAGNEMGERRRATTGRLECERMGGRVTRRGEEQMRGWEM
ncbi:hypothetical protein OH76DRAFT_461053 [Lentinus brumalis]|uniref:Uncharacterized protein n=1 Tax=Lentinus brumalis TaxID=2498619 RepID=A0A371CIE4_9APHY|nr:hypothetical protein OH76DRAFT_461053 [Polyporus brumalis]